MVARSGTIRNQHTFLHQSSDTAYVLPAFTGGGGAAALDTHATLLPTLKATQGHISI